MLVYYVKQTEYILPNRKYQLRNIADSQGQIQRLFDLDSNHECEYMIKGKSKKGKKSQKQYISVDVYKLACCQEKNESEDRKQ